MEKRLMEKQVFCNMNQAILYTDTGKSYSVPIIGLQVCHAGPLHIRQIIKPDEQYFSTGYRDVGNAVPGYFQLTDRRKRFILPIPGNRL